MIGMKIITCLCVPLLCITLPCCKEAAGTSDAVQVEPEVSTPAVDTANAEEKDNNASQEFRGIIIPSYSHQYFFGFFVIESEEFIALDIRKADHTVTNRIVQLQGERCTRGSIEMLSNVSINGKKYAGRAKTAADQQEEDPFEE